MSENVASLSLDLDNQWSYLKTHGDESWRGFPSYLDLVVPHIMEISDSLGLSLTVFVVGQDAELAKNADSLAALGESRHEISNHSFHHEPWLHLRSAQQILDEIQQATEAIEQATGRVPRGFRGPGFSVSQATIRVLSKGGYVYDASTLPTFIGPLARAYYLHKAPLGDEERQRRQKLFGTFSEGFRSIKPYKWELGPDEHLIEIPVTTLPLFRIPIHLTYVLYLARFSESVALSYFRTSLAMCRLAGVEPSILIHSLDFLGGDEISDLSFFPGMDMDGESKRRLVRRFIGVIQEKHRVITMAEHASRVADGVTSVQSIRSLA